MVGALAFAFIIFEEKKKDTGLPKLRHIPEKRRGIAYPKMQDGGTTKIYFYDAPSERVKEEHVFLNNFSPSVFVLEGATYDTVCFPSVLLFRYAHTQS